MLALLVLTAMTSMALAGSARKAYLTRPQDAVDEDAKGFVKIKAKKDGELQLFEVKIKKVDPGTYDVAIDGEPVAQIEVQEGQHAGKFKVNTRRGDELGVEDPAGKRVEVSLGGDLVLKGVVPDPLAPKTKNGTRKEDLEPPEEVKKAGFVMAKAGRGAEILKVLVCRVEPGSYGVFMDDGELDPSFAKIGEITVPDGESCGTWMMNNRRGDAYPFDLDSVEDVVGRTVEVRTGEGDLVGSAVVPDPSAPKDKGKPK